MVDKGAGATPDGYEPQKGLAGPISGQEDDIIFSDLATRPQCIEVVLYAAFQIGARQVVAVGAAPTCGMQAGNVCKIGANRTVEDDLGHIALQKVA
ncbi:hypothetical protein [uncultured Cohaesibacter sp.]|uniref:hypothetical protein n=1 Tax=uncultured Cohaesibacter sp. TaxID=1002546 RepID=UPI00293059A2|nr:hypothetical protein [uncultured Cohaesibacter sp.]